MQETKPLHSVHDAMLKAVLNSKNKPSKLETATFKVQASKKELAEVICRNNGTTLSEFLRECVNGLVEDYVGPKVVDSLDQEQA